MPPALFGRDHPAGVLRSEIARATDSHGGLVLVTGEAGIGKSTLVTDAAHEARRRGALVVGGSCWDSDNTPPPTPPSAAPASAAAPQPPQRPGPPEHHGLRSPGARRVSRARRASPPGHGRLLRAAGLRGTASLRRQRLSPRSTSVLRSTGVRRGAAAPQSPRPAVRPAPRGVRPRARRPLGGSASHSSTTTSATAQATLSGPPASRARSTNRRTASCGSSAATTAARRSAASTTADRPSEHSK